MAAAVACTFQSLSHLGVPALDQALLIVDKVKVLNSSMIQRVLCERAKIFIEQFPRSDSTGTQQHDGDVQSKIVSKEVEAFSLRLIDILFGPTTYEAEPEPSRMKRAVLAMTYANSAAASEIGRLTSTLEEWLDKERSGPIREIVKRALLAISRSA